MDIVVIKLLYFLPLLIWIFLLGFRGQFWRCDQVIGAAPKFLMDDSILVIIPARNESEVIRESVQSLTNQHYKGKINVVVIDDGSQDGTASAAKTSGQVTVIKASDPPCGWTGKLWAVQYGFEFARKKFPDSEFFLFSDADIYHSADSLNSLVFKAKTENLDLVSLMVRLHCKSFWEVLLIPPFVFFFQKLYPFRWVNNPIESVAAAAGGCMLVRKSSLIKAGGISAIKGSLIDDCAMAKSIKRSGKIWLGLAGSSKSLRQYCKLHGIWEMVTRTAFTQINYSILNLFGATLGMSLTYLLPLVLLLFGVILKDLMIFFAGFFALTLMFFSYCPTIKYFGVPKVWVLTLPLAGFLYTLMTIGSAIQHWQGKGGAWKGRVYR